MRFVIYILFVISLSVISLSCDNKPKHEDTLSTGSVEISADETYRAVIEQQKNVFDSSFPNAKVTIHYKSEAACFKDYFEGNSRVILVTRDLTKDERLLAEQKKFYATSVGLAKDAVVVMLNNKNPDTLLNVHQLKAILTGKFNKTYKVVFDNQASSLVRYMTDSLLQGQPLGANVYAAKSDSEVLDYVQKNEDAIGFAGLANTVDPEDKGNTGNFISSVRIVSLYNDTLNMYLKPYMAYLALKHYPLVRKLFYINKESYPGIGTGFANFLGNTQGQLIFAHAHLYPLRMEITLRKAEINNGN